MSKNMKYGLSVFVLLVAVYALTVLYQQNYTSNSMDLYQKDEGAVCRVVIKKGSEELEIIKVDTSWQITGHDSLIIKENSIENLFEKVLKTKKGTVLSINPEKYAKYSVDDSSGTHLILYDPFDDEIGHFIFGSSKSDYSRNNVRVKGDESVYQTDQNVVWIINTRPDYWGQKPKPPEPDTTNVH